MSLFEKLKAMTQTAAPAAPAADPQCNCGSALLDECEECAPVGEELMEHLHAVGKKGVNPPPVVDVPQEKPVERPVVAPVAAPVVMPAAAPGVGRMPVTTVVLESGTTAEVPVAAAPAETRVLHVSVRKKDESLGGTCETCGKTFEHIRRHKCKAAVITKVDGSKVVVDGGQAVAETKPPVVETKPPVAETKPPAPVVVETRVVVPPKNVTFSVGAPAAPAAAPPEHYYLLLLDAIFERTTLSPQHFSTIIAPLADAVAKENNQPHWNAVEYGRGPALLAAKLEAWIKTQRPRGTLLADSSTPEVKACKEVLRRYATDVIQGVR